MAGKWTKERAEKYKSAFGEYPPGYTPPKTKGSREIIEAAYTKWLSGEELSPQDSTILRKSGKIKEPKPDKATKPDKDPKLITVTDESGGKTRQVDKPGTVVAPPEKKVKKSESDKRTEWLKQLHSLNKSLEEAVDNTKVVPEDQLIDWDLQIESLQDSLRASRNREIMQRQEKGGKRSMKRFERRIKASSRPDGVYFFTLPDGGSGKAVSIDGKWVKNSAVFTKDGEDFYTDKPPEGAEIQMADVESFKATLRQKYQEMVALGMSKEDIEKELSRLREEAGLDD